MKSLLLRGALCASMAVLLLGAPQLHAATSVDFTAGTLAVSSDAADPLVVDCAAGNVRLNGTPVAGPVACAAVVQVQATGGPGANMIDLSGALPADFVGMLGSVLVGGPGADTLLGSFAADELVWNPGDGSDSNDGGLGTDRVVVNGSDTANTFTVGTAGAASGFDLRFVGPFTIDIVRAEVLEINGRGGDDSINASGLPAGLIALEITGGTGTDTIVGSAGVDRMIWNPGDGSDSNDGGLGTDRVVVNGSDTANTFTVNNAAAPGFALRFVGPFTIDIRAAEVLEINGRGGDDSINASGLPAGLIALEITGGTGTDTIVGSAGDDRMIWNPGDGSDTNDGGLGNDRVVVNGSNGANTFTMSGAAAAGFDLRFVGPFTIDIDNAEVLEVNGNGGDDIINAVALPAGLISLELQGGDGLDTITGSAGNDSLRGGPGNDTLVGFLGADQVLGEGGDDLMIWNPGDGSDFNDGGEGNDISRVLAAGVAENFTIAPLNCGGSACVRIRRNLPTLFDVDGLRVEQLELETGGGRDTVSTQPLPGVMQLLDGGSPDLGGIGVDFFPVDGLQVAGIRDPRTSPVEVAGFGDIHHANFEFAPTMVLAAINREAGHTADLTGAQEVPPVNTTASARGSVVLNAAQTQITVRLSFSGLSSANTMSHIHGPALPGVNAGVIFDLGNSGSTSGELGPLQFAVNAAQVAQLKNGLWYFNIHSVNHGSGEVRGQIRPDRVFEAYLQPQQVVGDNVISAATGFGTVTLAGTEDSVVVTLAYNGLTGEGAPGVSTGVRLRGPAPRGANGAALTDFPLRVSSTANDQFITQEYPITAQEVADLKARRWYFEVQSQEFPDGELRGQVDNLLFCSGFEATGCR
ncbi:MAG: CHRD domain-containing protein [Pseudomarimonas sp.]